MKFALAAVAIIAAGIWLSFIGNEMAIVMCWDKSFVGSSFLAITSSLPEVVVAVAALRIGAMDMAIAALLGSNMFNMLIIAPSDIFYKAGPILSSVSVAHIFTGLLVILMTVIVIAALHFRAKRKTFRIASWYAPSLVGLYALGSYASFTSLVRL
jgi:cation:H+ antiporter